MEYFPIFTVGSIGRISVHFVKAHLGQEAPDVRTLTSRPLTNAGEDGRRKENEEEVLHFVRLVQAKSVILHQVRRLRQTEERRVVQREDGGEEKGGEEGGSEGVVERRRE